ncbi:MAG: DUF1080 domain-containing protein [Planctomycetota bacterium]|nr:DUF1080 domain-containing protein [Planctomycetota bacterium]
MAMKRELSLCLLSVGFLVGLFELRCCAAELVHAKDGSGVYGYDDTPELPWCGYRVHDANRPLPKRVDVGPGPEKPAVAPADAIVLFDGKDLSKWQKSDWRIVDSWVEAVSGGLTTKEAFGDCQIHVEWMGPANFQGPWYNQGNNGVFLMGLYEIQIFDSLKEKIYPDGMAGAIYGQTPPLVNACRPGGQWQSFDIVFTTPVFEGEKLIKPARVTILHNGVLVQNNEEIRGDTLHRDFKGYSHKQSTGPLVLSGHDCPVRFRNIWVRPLSTSGTAPAGTK